MGDKGHVGDHFGSEEGTAPSLHDDGANTLSVVPKSSLISLK